MILKNWIKKNTFYKVLAAAVILAVSGYMIWFFQPMPLIPDGAENISIEKTGVFAGGSEPVSGHIIYGIDSNDAFDLSPINLSKEGIEKLIDALRGQKVRAYWSVEAGKVSRYKERFNFVVRYELNGVEYHRRLDRWADIEVETFWYSVEEGAKPGLSPSLNHKSRIIGAKEAEDFYETVLDIIKNYTAENDSAR